MKSEIKIETSTGVASPPKVWERKLPKINENERKVLTYLSEDWDEMAYYFRGIVKHTGLELAQVRRACRSLARKGYAEYRRGLFNEDGMTAGSGYSATFDGALLVNGCKDCKKRISDMITGQCQTCWEKEETEKRLKEMWEKDGIPTSCLVDVSLYDLGMLREYYKENGKPIRLTSRMALAQVNRLVKPYQRKYSA